MPKVSFVVATYNREDYVENTIRSMLEQSYEDFEVVIIDDCSTDRTFDVVLKYENDPRVSVYRNQINIGLTKSLIKAISHTSGEYIAYVDAGDECMPQRLEQQVRYLDNNPDVGAVGSWVELCSISRNFTETVQLDAGDNPAEKLLRTSFFWHSEVTFRRSVYDRVGGYRDLFYYSQDNDLWLRMSEVSRLCVIPKVLQRIYKFEGGISTTPEKFLLARTFRNFAVFCAKERRKGNPDPVRRFGAPSVFLRPRSKELAEILAMDGIKLMIRGNRESGRWVINRSLNEMKTWKTVSVYVLSLIPGLPLLKSVKKAVLQY
jgi:glycosyltransferase involved in cell wall biosynthesis